MEANDAARPPTRTTVRFGANLAVRYPSRERPFSDGERKPVGRVTCFRREPPLVDPRAADRVRSELTLMTAPPGEPHRRKADAQIVCDRAVTIWA